MKTRITDLFGIQYPIIQGAMQWLSKPKLAAAVSNAGGLGTINMTTYDTPEAFQQDIQLLKTLTDKPFCVNLSLLPDTKPDGPIKGFLQAITEEKVRIVETAGSSPKPFMDTLKGAGCLVMHKIPDSRFAHTAQEVEAIRSVGSTTAIQQQLRQAMADFSSSLVLRASYFTGDIDSVRSMAAQAYFDTPHAAFGMPDIQVALYPDSGTQRILEITLQWPEDQASLAARSEELVALALQLLRNAPPAGDSYTPGELVAILRQTAAPMDSAGAGDPYSALTGQPANLLAHTLALELLLQQAGFDVTLVNGIANGSDTCWLILDAGEGYRHLLLTDEEPTLYTDLELTALGYLWNSDLYPDCVDYGIAPSAAETPGSSADGTQSAQTTEG